MKQLMAMNTAGASRVSGVKPNVQLYVDCAGAKDLLMQSLAFAAEGTKYVVVSVYSEPLEINGSIFMGEPQLIGSAGYRPATIKEVIDHVENERTPIRNIITAQYSIDEFNTAMEKAAYKENKNIKVLINF